MSHTYKLVELFSGIGSQARALKNLNVNIETVATSEWDVHAIVAYDVIHNSGCIPPEVESMTKAEVLEKLKDYRFSNSGKSELEFSSLKTYSEKILKHVYTSVIRNKNVVDITTFHGSLLPSGIDIMTYSFPCQDLSCVGSFHGYNKGIDKNSGSRSSLLWQVGRILSEMQANGIDLPRFLLMENVPSLLSKRHYTNFKTWMDDLSSLGYVNKYFQLNANWFGLPQNRPRLLMISIYVGQDVAKRTIAERYQREKYEDGVVADYEKSGFYKEYSISDMLRLNYSNRELYNEALECVPNDTVSRAKIWEQNPQIVLPDNTINPELHMVRTITTKQDRHPNSGNLYFDFDIPGKCKWRYLTPRECMLFMGFTEEDFLKLKKTNYEFHKGDHIFSRDKIIRVAGNSIPVKLMEGVFWQILKIDDLLNNGDGCS